MNGKLFGPQRRDAHREEPSEGIPCLPLCSSRLCGPTPAAKVERTAMSRATAMNANAVTEGQRPGSIPAWAKARHERRPRFGSNHRARAEGPPHRLAGLRVRWCRAFSPLSLGGTCPWALPKAGMEPGLWPSIAAARFNGEQTNAQPDKSQRHEEHSGFPPLVFLCVHRVSVVQIRR